MIPNRASPGVISPEIERITIHNSIQLLARLYASPFLCKLATASGRHRICWSPLLISPAPFHLATALYPLLYYTYYHKYDEWVKSEEWTFIYCVLLGAGHALSFLSTRWNLGIQSKIECTTAESLETAELVRVIPKKNKGKGDIVKLARKKVEDGSGTIYSFIYQRDTFVYNRESR